MEQLNRIELLVGTDNLFKIINKTVLILGLGGVGSYAVESLARMGIKNLILVDKDVIDITNLNRQLMTDHTNVGKYKTDVLKVRINNINPNCNVKIITECITEENINMLFVEPVDYIVDACDTISTKKCLIKECLNRNISLISSMGTGNKLDPTLLEIIKLDKTSYDPIAKILRKYVKDNRLKGKIMVICSKEKPLITNSKIIASTSFVPAVAGLLCTSYIINDILKSGVYEKNK